MNCAYCNGPCDDRPVRYEAVCWACHVKHQVERRKKEQPGFMKRLAASMKRNKPILDGLSATKTSEERS